MSSGPQVALLPPLGRHEMAPRLRTEAPPARPLARGVPGWRLLGLLALALILVVAGTVARRRSFALALVLVALAALAMLPLAGVPLNWLLHVRIAVTASAIGDGLSALPGVLVPYTGVDEWVRLVISLGAGVLLIDAAA